MWQYSVFFWLRHVSHLDKTIIHHREPHVTEIAVADIDEAYLNIKNGTSCKNGNVTELLTVFTESPIPDTWSQALISSQEDE